MAWSETLKYGMKCIFHGLTHGCRGSKFPVARGAIAEGLTTIMAGKALTALLVVIRSDERSLPGAKQLQMAVVANQTFTCMGAAVKDHLAFARTLISQRLALVSSWNLTNP